MVQKYFRIGDTGLSAMVFNQTLGESKSFAEVKPHPAYHNVLSVFSYKPGYGSCRAVFNAYIKN